MFTFTEAKATLHHLLENVVDAPEILDVHNVPDVLDDSDILGITNALDVYDIFNVTNVFDVTDIIEATVINNFNDATNIGNDSYNFHWLLTSPRLYLKWKY
jgi:hypothetical protein